ncbi:Homeobox protein HD-8 [Nosema bombycis CQ1]|jgi:hypothetical protein|uniref:Homeobox protein HD-8 n=1 Tax=Nosema bombycis (strain CQ1 / CVCC 102059) TaxID=578461 RepID=R0M5I5_NOSB1|nr:Homeobox protein HD-8 [Nosema bombycis CQ1]|eukprot:EOB13264.1 Homeobox protein HD-8 [Nosema bombycis CQ1]
MNEKIVEDEKVIQAALGLVKLGRNEMTISSGIRGCKKSLFQNMVLREVFKLTMYPSPQTKIDLSILLNLSEKAIKVWFQNERQNEKLSFTSGKYQRSQKFEISALILYRIFKKVNSILKMNK